MISHEIRAPYPEYTEWTAIWDLTYGTYAVVDASGAVQLSGSGPMVATGIEGMGDPEVDVFARDTPRVAGRVRTGTRALPRTGFLPLVWEAQGVDWLQSQRLFWSCVSSDRVAAWRVTAPDGEWRELEFYLDPKDTVYEKDPTVIRQRIGLALVADNPYWLGPARVIATASQETGALFLGSGNAPPFYIDSGTSSGNEIIRSAGDVDAWPVLTVYGQSSGFQTWMGVAPTPSNEVSAQIYLSAGQVMRLDFDPSAQALMIGTANFTSSLSRRGFFMMPTDQTSTRRISLVMVGTGYAEMTYRPKWRRAV